MGNIPGHVTCSFVSRTWSACADQKFIYRYVKGQRSLPDFANGTKIMSQNHWTVKYRSLWPTFIMSSKFVSYP